MNKVPVFHVDISFLVFLLSWQKCLEFTCSLAESFFFLFCYNMFA